MSDRMPKATKPIDRLIEVMARLRDTVTGCPWDREQDFASIAPYTIEEAYEVADAIARRDMPGLKEELGDLLLQVVYHAQMASELAQQPDQAQSAFDFEAVAAGIADKMVRRHPHVFGDDTVENAAGQTSAWEQHKAAERAAKAQTADRSDKPASALDGVAIALPALLRADKLQKRASRVGFDWNDPKLVLDKLEEEIAELRAEMAQGAPPDRMTDEIGDMLFVVANLARHFKIDPEAALRQANAKFERRFRYIETSLSAQGRTAGQASLEEMEALWQDAKKGEPGR
ncbi:MAG: nucleoside triphosphate pyrophosphohydrolase [Rhodospirillales bacterium]